jgi:PAS domain S-box-containing protein
MASTQKDIAELQKKIAGLEKKVSSYKEEKENYRTLFNSILFGIQEIDTKGTILYANDAHHKIHGYLDGELIGKSMLDLTSTESEKTELASYLEYLVKEKPTPEPWLGTDIKKDGSLVDVRVDWNYKLDEKGAVKGFISLITDITEKKGLEANLEESSKKFQAIFEHSPLAIMYFDEHGTITICNDNAAKLFGAPKEKLIGFSCKDLKNKQMRDAVETALASQKSHFSGEYVSVTGNKYSQIRANFNPSLDHQGSVTGVIGIFEDISEISQIATELGQREAEFEAIFHSISDAVVFVDQQRHMIMVNKAFTSIFGYQLDEVVGRTTEFFYANPEEFHDQGKIRYHVGANVDSPIYEIDYRRKDGSVFPSETLGAAVKNKSGETIGFIGIIRDISERKQILKNLLDSEVKFKSIIESSPMGVFLYSLKPGNRLVFTDANPAADNILQLDCKQFIGKTIEEAFPALVDTELPDRFRAAARDGIFYQKEQMEYSDKQIAGAFEVLAFQTAPNTIAVLFSDITKRRQMEQELQKVQKLESIGILAGGIAHDFNNILTGILGNLSLTRRYIRQDETEALDKILATEKATYRAQDLTYQLLTFAKGGSPITKPVSVTELIRESVSFTMSGANVTCDFDAEPDLWPVEVDEGQISQVIQNLTTNALHAMPRGGTITVRLKNRAVAEGEISSLPAGKYIKISICDQGLGIPQKYQGAIFEPFFTTKGSGSGLGLAICYSIIKKHKGHITFDSLEDQGTCFYIYIPASEKTPVAIDSEGETFISGQGRILLMDDDELVREVAAEMLSLAGYKVELAADGLVAIDYFQKAMDAGQPYDAVILDLTIPGGMGGKETMTNLLEIDPDAKGIVSSGYSTDAVMAEYEKHGFRGVITKPYKLDELTRKLAEIIKQ